MKRLFNIAVALMMVSGAMNAQTAEPTLTFFSKDAQDDVVMNPGEEQSVQAPLDITLEAHLSDYTGWKAACEWKIYDSKQGESSPLVTRFDENTSYTLTKHGTYKIKLYVTFTTSDNDTIEYECEPFEVTITESKLSCPDGFSPNNDHINDVFKVTYQSIVKMSGVFFNRWGQRVYSFDLSNVDKGWDGRQSNGEYVKDGTYYLNLQATGSDGVKYDIKKAVTVLKGFRELNQ